MFSNSPYLVLWLILTVLIAGCSGNSRLIEIELSVAQGKYDYAIGQYQEMVEQDPENAEIYYHLAKAYFDSKQYIDAIDSIKIALLLAPNKARYRLLLGRCYFYLKDYFDAITQLTTAVSLDNENLRSYLYLANAYQEVGKNKEAIKQLKLAMALEPLYFDARLALVRFRFQKRTNNTDYKSLITQLQDALTLKPNSVAGNLLLSELYQAIGEDRKAKIVISDHINGFGETDKALLALAQLEYQSGHYQKADEVIKRITTKTRESQLLALKIDHETRPVEDLITRVKQLIASYPDSESLYFFHGTLEYQAGNLVQAERLFQTALKINPEYGEAYYYLSKIWDDNNDFVGAASALKKAFELIPNHFDLFVDYLTLLIEQGEWEKAADYLEEQQTNPQNSKVLYLQGLIAKRKGLYYEAENFFRQSQQQRFSAKVETQIADMEIQRGQYQAAGQRLKMVLALKPHEIEAVLIKAKLLFITDKIDQIPPLLWPYLTNKRAKGRVHQQLAEALVQLDRMEKALSVLTDGLENWPRHPELTQMQTLYLGITGEYAKAIRILEDMQSFEHKYNQLFHYRLSGYYYKTGEKEKFRKYLYRYNFKKGLEQYSDYLYRYIIRQKLMCTQR